MLLAGECVVGYVLVDDGACCGIVALIGDGEWRGCDFCGL